MQHRTGQHRTNCKLNCFYCRNIIQEESTRNCTWRKKAYSKFCMTFLSLHSWFPYGLIHNPAKTHLQNYLEHLFFLALYHFGRLLWKFSALMSKSLLISSLCLFVVNSYLSIPGSLNVKCSGAVLQFVVLSSQFQHYVLAQSLLTLVSFLRYCLPLG